MAIPCRASPLASRGSDFGRCIRFSFFSLLPSLTRKRGFVAGFLGKPPKHDTGVLATLKEGKDVDTIPLKNRRLDSLSPWNPPKKGCFMPED